MPSETVEIGDTEVEIRETEDGFEAVEVEQAFGDRLRGWADAAIEGGFHVKTPDSMWYDGLVCAHEEIPYAKHSDEKPHVAGLPEDTVVVGLRPRRGQGGSVVYFDDTAE